MSGCQRTLLHLFRHKPKRRDMHHKWFSRRSLSALPGRLAKGRPGRHQQCTVSARRTEDAEALEV